MKFHVLTLFPEMILQGLNTSITGRAIDSGYISLEAVNIRDFAENKHNRVDDYPYGGGAGMVMQAGPVCKAFESVAGSMEKKPRVIYLTPQGSVFTRQWQKSWPGRKNLYFCAATTRELTRECWRR